MRTQIHGDGPVVVSPVAPPASPPVAPPPPPPAVNAPPTIGNPLLSQRADFDLQIQNPPGVGPLAPIANIAIPMLPQNQNPNNYASAPVEFTFAANTFNDTDALTYSYTVNTGTGGFQLASAVSFNPAQRKFTIDFTNISYGFIIINVTATDTANQSVTDSFVVNSANQSNLAGQQIDGYVESDNNFYSFSASQYDISTAFRDPDNIDTVTSLVINNGNALPAGITYNSGSKTFTFDFSITDYDPDTGVPIGTPFEGPYTIPVRANFASGESLNSSFAVTTPLQFQPSQQNIIEGEASEYTLSATGGLPPYSYQVGTLPSGVNFSASQGKFIFTSSVAAGNYNINVTASDSANNQVSNSFVLSAISGTYRVAGTSIPTPVSVGSTMSTDSTKPVQAMPSANIGNNVTEFSVGRNNVCALISDGTVKCWGGFGYPNTDGSTNIIGVNNAVSVSTLINHGCAVISNGTVRCWGNNAYGKLGDGTTNNTATPTTSVAVSGITNAVKVSVGASHSCAILSTGAIQCWGRNNDNNLGDGTGIDSSTPVSVSGISSGATDIMAGSRNTCAVVSGQVKCWGYQQSGEFGNGTSYTEDSPPVTATGVTGATRVFITRDNPGGAHSCAIVASGAVKCWGDGFSGKLGNNATSASNTPVDVSGLTGAVDIALGDSHSCIRKSSGQVWCWGYGQAFGQSSSQSTPVQLSGTGNVSIISAGQNYVMMKTQ